jgi:hypothetical protein
MLEDVNKRLSLASFVYGTNMAAVSLSSHSLGNECNPRVGLLNGVNLTLPIVSITLKRDLNKR